MNSCEKLLNSFMTCSGKGKITCLHDVEGFGLGSGEETVCKYDKFNCVATNKDEQKIKKLIKNKSKFNITYMDDDVGFNYPNTVPVEIGFKIEKMN